MDGNAPAGPTTTTAWLGVPDSDATSAEPAEEEEEQEDAGWAAGLRSMRHPESNTCGNGMAREGRKNGGCARQDTGMPSPAQHTQGSSQTREGEGRRGLNGHLVP